MADAKRVASDISYRRSCGLILVQAGEMRGRRLCKQQNCAPFVNPLDSFRVPNKVRTSYAGLPTTCVDSHFGKFLRVIFWLGRRRASKK